MFPERGKINRTVWKYLLPANVRRRHMLSEIGKEGIKIKARNTAAAAFDDILPLFAMTSVGFCI
jgi:hypothetical protein